MIKNIKHNQLLNTREEILFKMITSFILLSFLFNIGLPHLSLAQAMKPEISDEVVIKAAPSTYNIVNEPVVEVDAVLVEEPGVRYVKYVTVTAYSSTVDQTDDTPFITANGTHVHHGTIAANFLKFGAKVRFPDYFGDRVFIVEDRTHPRYGDRVDIWMETREDALQFGIRKLRIEVLETVN